MSREKSQIEALSILVEGVRIAQSRGCYSLEEASDLCGAVREFTDPPAQPVTSATPPVDDVVAARRKPGRPKK